VNWRDIGHGVRIRIIEYDDQPHGIEYQHPNGDATCDGWVPFKPASNDGWTVESLQPLTLSPSLLCRKCGHHGFIKNGAWVPA